MFMNGTASNLRRTCKENYGCWNEREIALLCKYIFSLLIAKRAIDDNAGDCWMAPWRGPARPLDKTSEWMQKRRRAKKLLPPW